jgi:enoyl-CoA hydratase/carnithine racemase
MSYQHIDVEIANHVGTIWLNRPERLNALSSDMWDDIPAVVGTLNQDQNVRVIVLAGRGPSFTAGIDVAMLAGLNPEGTSRAVASQRIYENVKKLQQTTSVFADSPKPTIASIHGFCIGAGIDLITACDIRMASEDAIFSIRETKMGLVADVGTLQRIPSIVNSGHVAELAFTGKDFDSGHALKIGLVNHVFPDLETLNEGVLQLAGEIAANSPLVVSGVKNVLAANRGRGLEESLDYVAHWNSSYLLSDDLFEAINAYIEKRPPEFTGK